MLTTFRTKGGFLIKPPFELAFNTLTQQSMGIST